MFELNVKILNKWLKKNSRIDYIIVFSYGPNDTQLDENLMKNSLQENMNLNLNGDYQFNKTFRIH